MCKQVIYVVLQLKRTEQIQFIYVKTQLRKQVSQEEKKTQKYIDTKKNQKSRVFRFFLVPHTQSRRQSSQFHSLI